MPSVSATTVAAEPRVRAAIAQAARDSGIDFGYLYNQARAESGLNPHAKATTSSATGLFQFTNQTWLQMVKTHGAAHGAELAAEAIERNGARLAVTDPRQQAIIDDLRYDPEFSSAMAAEYASDNRSRLEDGLGRSVDPTDLYIAHFLGSAGAVKFLTAYDADPSAPAAPLFPAAAAANRSIFYGRDGAMHSLADIRSRFAAKLDAAPPDAPTAIFAAEQRWTQTTQTRRTIVEANPRPSMEMAAIEPLSSRLPMEMAAIEPLPPHLSLDFAARAYQRLAGLGA